MQETGEFRPVALLAESPAGALDLFRPIDVLAVGDSLWVVDNGNDRIVVLDRELRTLGTLGGEGEGPGEFQQPVAVRSGPDGVMVVDMGNSRFTVLDRAGRTLRTFDAPPGTMSFAVSASGAAVVPSRTGRHAFARVDGGSVTDLGAMPATPAEEQLPAIRAGLRDPRITLTAGDTVHVFDEATAVLSKYTPHGELLMARALPRAFRDSILERRDGRNAGLAKQGLNVVSATLAKHLSVTSSGELLLLVAAGETAGLLIDPGAYSVRRLVVPGNEGWARILTSARAAQLVDSVLYVLQGESVFAFRMGGPS